MQLKYTLKMNIPNYFSISSSWNDYKLQIKRTLASLHDKKHQFSLIGMVRFELLFNHVFPNRQTLPFYIEVTELRWTTPKSMNTERVPFKARIKIRDSNHRLPRHSSTWSIAIQFEALPIRPHITRIIWKKNIDIQLKQTSDISVSFVTLFFDL